MGQFVSRAVVASSGSPTVITWTAVSASLLPNGEQDIEHALVENQVWAMVVSMFFSDIFFVYLTSLPATLVNPNATETLNAALVAADGAYTPDGAITVHVTEARNENA